MALSTNKCPVGSFQLPLILTSRSSSTASLYGLHAAVIESGQVKLSYFRVWQEGKSDLGVLLLVLRGIIKGSERECGAKISH